MRLHRTGEFARRAGVTVRTLRYYDRLGLLSPSQRTESGYRLYSDEDLGVLQQILALRFLGFSLDEIERCLARGPAGLARSLSQQREMLKERQRQLDEAVRAIERAEALLAAGRCDWDAVLEAIEVMSVDQKQEWVRRYFSEEQLRAMQELSEQSYSPEARASLAGREWTEEDQQRVDEQWRHVYSEAARLAAAGAGPDSEDALALARLKADLIGAFTQGDAEVEAGLQRFWETMRALPEGERPFSPSGLYGGTPEGDALLDAASALLGQQPTCPRP